MNWYYQKHMDIDIKIFWGEIAKMSIGMIPVFVVGAVISLYAPMNAVWRLVLFIALYTAVYGVDSWFVTMNRYEKELIASFLSRIKGRAKRRK